MRCSWRNDIWRNECEGHQLVRKGRCKLVQQWGEFRMKWMQRYTCINSVSHTPGKISTRTKMCCEVIVFGVPLPSPHREEPFQLQFKGLLSQARHDGAEGAMQELEIA